MLREIHLMRKDLRHVLRTPRRWEGVLREGYQVAEDDAAAAVDGDGPISTDEKTFLKIQGYRQALGYVLAMGDGGYATFDATEIRAMHYMMLSHDDTKSPGCYRKGPIYGHDARHDRVVYEGPDAADVPKLIDALVDSLHTEVNSDPVVRSAMAHLNLVPLAAAGAGTTQPANRSTRYRSGDVLGDSSFMTRINGWERGSASPLLRPRPALRIQPFP